MQDLQLDYSFLRLKFVTYFNAKERGEMGKTKWKTGFIKNQVFFGG